MRRSSAGQRALRAPVDSPKRQSGLPSLATSSGQQAARFLQLICPQRDVARVIEHDLLSFAAEDEAYEFVERRRQRLARRLVDVEEREAAQRIGGERHVLV